MYVIKVMHGYIGKDGRRTREKDARCLKTFSSRRESEVFADKIGGRVKALAEVNPHN